MLGHVLNYSIRTGEGIISGEDGNRYSFTNRDWIGADPPERGARVEFTGADGQATNVWPSFDTQGNNQSGSQFDLRAVAAGTGAGCVAGCVVLLVLGLILGYVGIYVPRLQYVYWDYGPSGIIALLIVFSAAALAGCLVYQALRNRRR